jgi:CheY-like chemotaxis protein
MAEQSRNDEFGALAEFAPESLIMNLNVASDTRLHGGGAPGQIALAMGAALQRSLASEAESSSAVRAEVLKPLGLLPRHILLLGVDEPHQGPVLDILARWDVAAEVASNGAEALQIASAGEFDLILIDANRSILDGVFVSSRLRRLERECKARTPVALVAEVVGDWPSGEAVLRRAGVNDLLKGFTAAAAVRACLRRWCCGSYRSTRLVG